MTGVQTCALPICQALATPGRPGRGGNDTHEIDAGMKDEAIEALVGLRAELEHGQMAA